MFSLLLERSEQLVQCSVMVKAGGHGDREVIGIRRGRQERLRGGGAVPAKQLELFIQKTRGR